MTVIRTLACLVGFACVSAVGLAATAETDGGGVYSFEQVEAGQYGLGVGNPQGQLAPVAGPPIDLARKFLLHRRAAHERQALRDRAHRRAQVVGLLRLAHEVRATIASRLSYSLELHCEVLLLCLMLMSR